MAEGGLDSTAPKTTGDFFGTPFDERNRCIDRPLCPRSAARPSPVRPSASPCRLASGLSARSLGLRSALALPSLPSLCPPRVCPPCDAQERRAAGRGLSLRAVSRGWRRRPSRVDDGDNSDDNGDDSDDDGDEDDDDGLCTLSELGNTPIVSSRSAESLALCPLRPLSALI